MNRYKQLSLLAAICLAVFEFNCGGSPQTPPASTSVANTPTVSGTPVPSIGGTGGTDPTGSSGSGSGGGTGTSTPAPTAGSGSGGSGTSGSGSGSTGSSGGTPTNNEPNNPAPQGTTISNLHQQKGWTGYGLLPSSYSICSSCKSSGPKVTWSMQQGVTSPSQSGNSTQFSIGGQTSFADVLWNNHLIGQFSSQGLPDPHQTLVPSLHNFTYDVYFYVDDISKSQAVEFDINQFVNGKSFIWGHECRIAGGNEWDIWDNPGQKWHPTGVGCWPKNNDWNHLVIQAHRTSDDKLIFQSITLNGQTATLNYKEDPTPTNWYGVTINYQQDGDQNQQSYSVWLDKLNFTYW